MNPVNAVALTFALLALWIVRGAWRTPWERPALINLSLQTFDIVLSLRVVDHRASMLFHYLTGLWNMEEVLGHVCYMAGMFSLLYLVADRLDMTPNEFHTFVRYRIELPATIVIPLMVAFSVPAFGHERVPDTIAAEATDWMHAYWLLMCWSVVYILVQVFNALKVLRRQPENLRTANAYLAAIAVSGICCLAFVLELEPIQWVLVRCELVGYALAASYSWRIKVREHQVLG